MSLLLVALVVAPVYNGNFCLKESYVDSLGLTYQMEGMKKSEKLSDVFNDLHLCAEAVGLSAFPVWQGRTYVGKDGWFTEIGLSGTPKGKPELWILFKEGDTKYRRHWALLGDVESQRQNHGV